MLVPNTALGRFHNGFGVAMEDEEIVLSFGELQALDAPAEGGDAFLRLANLVKPVGSYEIRTMAIPSEALAYIDDDIDYAYSDAEEALGLAEEFGLLFGQVGVDGVSDVVRESLESWYAAVRVLNFAVRAEAMLANPPRAPENALDGEVVYLAEQVCDGIYMCKSAISWTALKCFGDRFPESYRTMLDVLQDVIARTLRTIPFDSDGFAF